MLIIHGTIISQEPESQIIEDGALRIVAGRIADIGSTADLHARYPQEEPLDAEEMLVLPGLISAHCHFSSVLTRGMALPGSSAVREPLRELWRALSAFLDYDDIRYCALAYGVEALQHGTTTLFDHHASPHVVEYALDALAEAMLQIGLRACLGYEVSDRYGTINGRRGAEENVRFARRTQGEPLLATMMGLDAAFHLSDDTLAAAVGAAAIADMGFHAHVAEDASDERESLARYNLRVVERLRKRGVLGPRTLAVHCVHITPAEMDLLAKAGSWVVHCPRSMLNDAAGLAPVPAFFEHGLPVALGSDGFAADMLREMEAAYLVHKHSAGYPHASAAQTALAMSQTNAALASRIFRNKLGELSVGAWADIIFLDYASPTPLTARNVPWHMVLGLDALHVDTTIVAGRVLMRHHEMLTVDGDAILARARQVASRLWSRLEYATAPT